MKKVAIFILILLVPSVAGAVPSKTTYQGVLASSGGEPISGLHDLRFTLYGSQDPEATVLWYETHRSVQVQGGIFQVVLGSQMPLSPGALDADELWVGVSVDDGVEIIPRAPLVAVPWAIRAAVADSVVFGAGSAGDGHSLDAADGDPRDAVFVNDAGDVGIGTSSPNARLHLSSAGGSWGHPRLLIENSNPASDQAVLGFRSEGVYDWEFGGIRDGRLFIRDVESGSSKLVLYKGVTGAVSVPEGNLGIGTLTPEAKIHIAAGGSSWGHPRMLVENTNPGSDQVAFGLRAEGVYDWEFAGLQSNGRLIVRDVETGANKLQIQKGVDGAVSIPTGRMIVPVLEVTGGSDIAEPFEMTDDGLPPGSAVVIDRVHHGMLSVSTRPYDRTVAGIISGAGGIRPGMSLSQDGVLEEGRHVALAGRVYARACAESGAIEPGDRLTTSSRPGVLMKAIDPDKAPGAIVGKALSALLIDEGLVLVLIQAQ